MAVKKSNQYNVYVEWATTTGRFRSRYSINESDYGLLRVGNEYIMVTREIGNIIKKEAKQLNRVLNKDKTTSKAGKIRAKQDFYNKVKNNTEIYRSNILMQNISATKGITEVLSEGLRGEPIDEEIKALLIDLGKKLNKLTIDEQQKLYESNEDDFKAFAFKYEDFKKDGSRFKDYKQKEELRDHIKSILAELE